MIEKSSNSKGVFKNQFNPSDYKELKDIFISKDIPAISQETNDHSFSIIPRGYTEEEYIQIRKSIILEIESITGQNIKNKIIMTGHQPDFIHPGILFKDVLTGKIANDLGATAFHLIVDTDQVGMDFTLPVKKGDFFHLEHFPFHKREHNIYKYVRIASEDIQKLALIRSKLESLDSVIPQKILINAMQTIESLLVEAKERDYIYQVTEIFRNQFIHENKINIIDIHLSDLIKTNGFKLFVEKIRARLPEFRNFFNLQLKEYRHLHKIKNKAQPVPDLKENEMPFWIVDQEGNRQHMLADSENLNIIPRANTLTMFLRLFIADLFIHGTGGGRYEAVSNDTLNFFFGTQGAPYIIASATMNLIPPPASHSAPSFMLKNQSGSLYNRIRLNQLSRSYEFSPERFLEKNHPLFIEKMNLILELNQSPIGAKKPIHNKIMALNDEIKLNISENKLLIDKMIHDLPAYEKQKDTFMARNLPYIFYDSEELIKYTKKLKF